jgi:hypothetical protein
MACKLLRRCNILWLFRAQAFILSSSCMRNAGFQSKSTEDTNMPRILLGTAAALTLGCALVATGPAAAAPVSSSAATVQTESALVPVARRGPRRGPPAVFRRGPVVPFVGPGRRAARVARIRRGWFRPGRRLWVLPALGAAAVALTLAPGWYWGDYYDDCHRWIVPCPGCAPQLVNLCEDY